MVREIIWDKEAILQLEEIYKYISERSLKAAEKVKRSIKETIQKLGRFPEVHNPDRFKNNNDGSFRAFEKYSYRVTYKISSSKVIIVRTRHTAQEPLEH